MDLSESRKKTVYGVEYRSMRSGCHGLLVYKTESQAFSASRRIREIEVQAKNGENQENQGLMVYYDLCDSQIPGISEKFQEIDHRDVKGTGEDKTYETDEYLVKIVNPVAYDIDD